MSTKILHVLDGFSMGGAETWLLQCVKYLSLHPELNVKFDFLITGGDKKIFDDEITSLGSKIYYHKFSMGNFFNFSIECRRILKLEDYYCIYDHGDFAAGWHFLAFLGRIPKVRITHLHNPWNFVDNYVINNRRYCSYKIGRLLNFLLTSKITGTSNSVMDEYGYDKWPYYYKRIQPIYCGFPVSIFSFHIDNRLKMRKSLNIDEDRKVCIFIGRIGVQFFDNARNQKNPEFAFQIANNLIELDDNWIFLFVGFKGSYGELLEKQVIECGKEDKIRFLGIRSDISALMSGSDVLLFPSLWEGLGMVTVEAQACNLPVIMSDCLPKESIVVPKLVRQLDLELPACEWASNIREFNRFSIDSDSIDVVKLVENSPFSIRNSVSRIVTASLG